MDVVNILYILHRFPSVTETFIAEEIRKVLVYSGDVKIYSLLPAKKGLVHPASRELSTRVHYVPGGLSLSLWWAQIYYFFRDPMLYWKLLVELLTEPAPVFSSIIKRLVIFYKSVWLAKELKGTDIKLIHTHFAWLSAAAGMVVSQLLDIPFTITAHAYDIYSKKNDLLKLTTNQASRVITISEFNKRAILNLNKVLSADKIVVIRCGIDLNVFQVTKNSIHPDKLLRIISIGRLEEKKGHEYLIRACSVLNSRDIQFNCVIIGEGSSRQSLLQLIQDHKLEEKVVLSGAKEQGWVRDRLCNSDIFVLACVVTEEGERDGIPVALMEALAMGVPVITTPVSGIPELIHHEETGLLVPERDPNSLANAILSLAKNPVLCKKLATNGRQLIESEYDISKNACRLVELFNKMIEEKAS
jgi:colanic acid/amylovoran biosynthesis glycosyltransferase